MLILLLTLEALHVAITIHLMVECHKLQKENEELEEEVMSLSFDGGEFKVEGEVFSRQFRK